MKDRTTKIILIVFFCIMFCFFPLFATNYYYNIQLSKSLFFTISTGVTVLCVLLFSSGQHYSIRHACTILRTVPGAIELTLFLSAAFLSAFLSEYRNAAFTGSDGRYIGFFFLLSAGISFFLFAAFSLDWSPYYRFLYLGCSLTALFAILQFVGIDPLGLSAHVPARLAGMYLSTIGQINALSGYLSMFVSFCLAAYCISGKRSLLIPLLIGFTALFPANSDSGFLCVFAVLLLLPLMADNMEFLLRYIHVGLVFGVSCYIGWILSFRAILPYQGIPIFLSSPYVFPCFLLVMIILLTAAKLFLFRPSRFLLFKKIYRLFFILLIIIVVTIFMLTNLQLISFSPLLLNDEWGSYRGFIWRKVIEVFVDSPMPRKLIGYGPDTLKPLLNSICQQEMVSVTGKIYDSAHNDFLQYLLTTGIIGAFFWLMFWLRVIFTTIKAAAPRCLPWLAALIAYFVQTMFIPAQPITAPLGFIIAGICIGMSLHTAKDDV